MNTLLQFAQTYTAQTTNTTEATPEQIAAIVAFLAVFFIMTLVFAVILYVLCAWFLGRIFKKAGIPAWIAWVPFYSGWKMNELGGQQGFWAVLAVIPLVNYVSVVFTFMAMYKIGLNLGKSGSFVLFAIFLPIVWMIWLAFDNSKWTPIHVAAAKN